MREQRMIGRNGHEHMPALNLDLKPKGRGASVRRAKDRYRERSGMEEREDQQDQQHHHDQQQQDRQQDQQREERRAAPKGKIDLREALQEAILREEPFAKEVDLAGDFARAAEDSDGEGEVRGGDEGEARPRIWRAERRSERRGRGRDDDFEKER